MAASQCLASPTEGTWVETLLRGRSPMQPRRTPRTGTATSRRGWTRFGARTPKSGTPSPRTRRRMPAATSPAATSGRRQICCGRCWDAAGEASGTLHHSSCRSPSARLSVTRSSRQRGGRRRSLRMRCRNLGRRSSCGTSRSGCSRRLCARRSGQRPASTRPRTSLTWSTSRTWLCSSSARGSRRRCFRSSRRSFTSHLLRQTSAGQPSSATRRRRRVTC
mmetsp:Transcript_12104/g.28702  ORF Transcript_12104/g.28702 Transcript_12104/m.28702 type:complete len:220 (+) Transcript_12104:3485-4144(+)